MKTSTLNSAISSVLSLMLIAPMASLADESTAALAAIKGASVFALGPTGVGGIIPESIIAMQKLNRQKNLDQIFRSEFDGSTPEGKLYIYCWAIDFAPIDAARFEASIISKNEKVTTMYGSILSRDDGKFVVKRIKDGHCGKLIIGEDTR